MNEEKALSHEITHQNSANQIDILARFADTLSSIRLVSYSISEILIPLFEQKVYAAQRLGWNDLEADSFDRLVFCMPFLDTCGKQSSILNLHMKLQLEQRIKI